MKKILIYIVFIIVVGVVSYNVILTVNKQKVPGKLDRLTCHKKVTSFERAYDLEKLKRAQKQIMSGNYKLTSDIDKAQFMESTLFKFINIEDTQKHLYHYLDSKTNKQRVYNNGITIDYTVFENDIEDPKKKSDKCKLYRGYVVLKIKNSSNKLLYQVQIDFMDYEGKDIFKTLDCTIESFLTY